MIPFGHDSSFIAIACSVLGLVPENQIFLGFGRFYRSSVRWYVCSSAAMFYTGLAQKIGGAVVKLFGKGENSLMFGIMRYRKELCLHSCLIPVLLLA